MIGDLNFARDGLVLANIEGTIMAIGGEHRGAPKTEIEAWNGERYICTNIQFFIQNIARYYMGMCAHITFFLRNARFVVIAQFNNETKLNKENTRNLMYDV